jgi:hypothetical protein
MSNLYANIFHTYVEYIYTVVIYLYLNICIDARYTNGLHIMRLYIYTKIHRLYVVSLDIYDIYIYANYKYIYLYMNININIYIYTYIHTYFGYLRIFGIDVAGLCQPARALQR